MSSILGKILYRFAKGYALNFLHEDHVAEKQVNMLKKKFDVLSGREIGKKIGISKTSDIRSLPLTSYAFYESYFRNPTQTTFMYPIDQYVKILTSGSMGKPKTFLLPNEFFMDNMKKAGFSLMLLSTHDGEKITFKAGDVIYTNLPPAPFISGFLTHTFKRQTFGLVKLVPDHALSFHEKVEYFIKNYEMIDIAYMTVTTLIDQIYPRIGKPFHLKGFITQDTSAGVLKEKIKEIIGTYPKVLYGSTETGLGTVPSIEYPGSFIFDWRVMYCEFIPEENAVSHGKPEEESIETVPLEEVKSGERYQPVVTPFKNDLTRYIMPDILQCISKSDNILNTDLPVFKFFSRIDKIIIMHNYTRIGEEEILHVMKEAGISFIDFTARVELYGTREHLTIYLEPSTPIKEEEAIRLLHEHFLKFDKDYKDLSAFLDYTPLKIHLLPRGTFQKYLSGKDGMPRIERIGMREDRFEELLRIAKLTAPQ